MFVVPTKCFILNLVFTWLSFVRNNFVLSVFSWVFLNILMHSDQSPVSDYTCLYLTIFASICLYLIVSDCICQYLIVSDCTWLVDYIWIVACIFCPGRIQADPHHLLGTVCLSKTLPPMETSTAVVKDYRYHGTVVTVRADLFHNSSQDTHTTHRGSCSRWEVPYHLSCSSS